jgi:hypothetical protein
MYIQIEPEAITRCLLIHFEPDGPSKLAYALADYGNSDRLRVAIYMTLSVDDGWLSSRRLDIHSAVWIVRDTLASVLWLHYGAKALELTLRWIGDGSDQCEISIGDVPVIEIALEDGEARLRWLWL